MTAARKPQARTPGKKAAQQLAVVAQEAEAGDGYVDIEQCGVPLRIPLRGKLPVKAYLAFKNGQDILGTELMLGEKQWAAFLEANPTIEDVGELGQKLDELAGN